MFKIFAETHKIIANNIYENIYRVHDIKLDRKKLLWGSVAPDYLPKYKFIRHYHDESINYITKEIINVIFISRYLELNKALDPITMSLLSNKIGIISHYLSDYVCTPHAKEWTFSDSMVKHIKYESKLNDFAENHTFRKNIINVDDIDIFDNEMIDMKLLVKDYIEEVIEEYSIKTSFKNDLDFALSLNLKITHFILDTISSYSYDIHKRFAVEF